MLRPAPGVPLDDPARVDDVADVIDAADPGALVDAVLAELVEAGALQAPA